MLKDKVILIIGGTSGIGRAATEAFVSKGAKVFVVGLAHGDEYESENVKVLHADIREESTASKALELCEQAFGQVDGLYHVAGGSGRKYGDGPLHEMSLGGWEETFRLNLTSIMLSNRAAVQYFLKHEKAGSILNLSSVLGSHPSPGFFTTHAYATAKGAVEGFVKSTAAYYAKNNIRINGLAPGLVETPMSQRASKDETIISFVKTKQPLDGGRNGQPSDLVGAASYFMSDYSKFTTGQMLKVDGGWSVTEGQY